MNFKFWIKQNYPPIIVFLLTFLISGYFSIIGVDAMHDGMMFRPALDVAEGKALFKDSFTLYGALSVWLHALVLFIFGKHLIVIRLTMAFFYGLCGVMFWYIWTRILSKTFTILSILAWIFLAPYFFWTFHPWPSIFSLFFTLVTSYFILRFIELNDKKFLFWAGIFSALAFWVRQPVGVFLVSAVCCLLLFMNYHKEKWVKKKHRKNNVMQELKNFSFGCLSISSIFITWIIISGAFNDWILQSFKFPSVWIKTLGHNYSFDIFFASFFPTLENHTTLLWSILPLITLYLFFRSGYRIIHSENENKEEYVLLALSTIALSSWIQYYPVHDIRHVYWAGAPMIGLAVYFCWELAKRNVNWGRYINLNENEARLAVFFAMFGILFFIDISQRVSSGIVKATSPYVSLEKPVSLKGMRVSPGQAQMYTSFSDDIEVYLTNHPNTKLLNISAQALFLVLDGNHPNIQPMYIDWGIWNTSIYPDYKKIIVKSVMTDKPILIAEQVMDLPGYCQKKAYTSPDSDHIALIFPCD